MIPFALTYTYGRLVKDQKQGWVLFAVMFSIWIGAAGLAMHYEDAGNPKLQAIGAVGGNMEGKEVRFGTAMSGLFAASTTGTSTGAVNSAHDSYTPLGGAVPLVHMMLGEVSPGGTGAGLYAILVFALLAVFIAGLMVGRTPEYIGKKIQATEMKLVVVYLIVMPLLILGFSSLSSVLAGPKSSILNAGPHGLSEIVYAFTSAANNNGSAFGGLTGNTDWYNTTLGLTMLFGRFFLIVPVLAIAGSLARKQSVPATAGTFPTNTPLFFVLLLVVVVVVVGLTYFPVVSLGPIVEHLTLMSTPDNSRSQCSIPGSLARGSGRQLPQARPAPHGPQPGHVRDGDRRRVRDDPVLQGPRRRDREGQRLRRLASPPGCGSPCSSPTSPRRWPRAAARPRPTTLRKTRAETTARRRLADGAIEEVPSSQLAVGDQVVVTAGEIIPADGDVVEGIASVDESAITGESAPVIRESGGDRSAVTGGTRVLSDEIVVRVTTRAGESFLDRMIALVEGASRQKTPNEIALDILLAGLTIILLLATVTLQPYAVYSGAEQSVIVLIALLVCLIPTTIGACSPRSALPAWTGSSSATSSP